MRIFFPEEQERGKQSLQQLSELPTLTPFHNVVLAFIQSLSQHFIKMRQYPEVVALGYWMRKANMNAIQQQWEQETVGRLIKARGTVFHIAPSNVDTIFIYSWLLSLLAGNRNIIRLSSKEQPQQHTLLQTILKELTMPAYQLLAERNVILTYEHDDEITEQLSMRCHVRVVWGGDGTVNSVRRIPLAPMASELVFPDRFSLAVIRADKFNQLEVEARRKLVQQFYNDAYWFDQLACSSPRMVVWHGQHQQAEIAQNNFWQELEEVHSAKSAELVSAIQVQKLTTGLLLAAEPETTQLINRPTYSRVKLDDLSTTIRERHCGGGFFLETVVRSLDDLNHLTADKDQTLSYFGYPRNELLDFADQLHNRGIDRIVPIGQALNFQEVWDGQSFLRSFTREVTII